MKTMVRKLTVLVEHTTARDGEVVFDPTVNDQYNYEVDSLNNLKIFNGANLCHIFAEGTWTSLKLEWREFDV